MAIFLTGMTTCSTHPDIVQVSQCDSVVPMWVDVQERGRGLPGGVFPRESQFETLIYVVNLESLCSTQMGVHFAETEAKITANQKLVFPIEGALANPNHERFLYYSLKDYRRIGPEELVAICNHRDLHGGRT